MVDQIWVRSGLASTGFAAAGVLLHRKEPRRLQLRQRRPGSRWRNLRRRNVAGGHGADRRVSQVGRPVAPQIFKNMAALCARRIVLPSIAMSKLGSLPLTRKFGERKPKAA
jgi:hypothetical protein